MSYLPEGSAMEVSPPPAAEYMDSQDPDELARRVLGHDPWHRDAAVAQAGLGGLLLGASWDVALAQAGRMCSFRGLRMRVFRIRV